MFKSEKHPRCHTARPKLNDEFGIEHVNMKVHSYPHTFPTYLFPIPFPLPPSSSPPQRGNFVINLPSGLTRVSVVCCDYRYFYPSSMDECQPISSSLLPILLLSSINDGYYRRIHAGVIVYIFAHMHTALHTEGNMLDMN